MGDGCSARSGVRDNFCAGFFWEGVRLLFFFFPLGMENVGSVGLSICVCRSCGFLFECVERARCDFGLMCWWPWQVDRVRDWSGRHVELCHDESSDFFFFFSSLIMFYVSLRWTL